MVNTLLDKTKTKEEVTLSRNSVTNFFLNKERLDTIIKTMAFVMLEDINETDSILVKMP